MFGSCAVGEASADGRLGRGLSARRSARVGGDGLGDRDRRGRAPASASRSPPPQPVMMLAERSQGDGGQCCSSGRAHADSPVDVPQSTPAGNAPLLPTCPTVGDSADIRAGLSQAVMGPEGSQGRRCHVDPLARAVAAE